MTKFEEWLAPHGMNPEQFTHVRGDDFVKLLSCIFDEGYSAGRRKEKGKPMLRRKGGRRPEIAPFFVWHLTRAVDEQHVEGAKKVATIKGFLEAHKAGETMFAALRILDDQGVKDIPFTDAERAVRELGLGDQLDEAAAPAADWVPTPAQAKSAYDRAKKTKFGQMKRERQGASARGSLPKDAMIS
ncbi:hypothetical protein [Methylocapsa palsarum]|uniref:Uncharacterized protein n=1 Tax=Methylocapsa palsarum TaxID=1612308 RepID=A0A1I3WRE9_9HYPH|nr:hypothetical protein [Methylocapsa palsarum]SFK10088.1 hypothetical protein SAMN05444581_10287 [Methylocapsa palsarum]